MNARVALVLRLPSLKRFQKIRYQIEMLMLLYYLMLKPYSTHKLTTTAINQKFIIMFYHYHIYCKSSKPVNIVVKLKYDSKIAIALKNHGG